MVKNGLLGKIVIGASIAMAGSLGVVLTLAAAGVVPLTAEENNAHCEFLNYDDSFLYDCSVKRGSNVVYDGPEPTKPSDEIYTYRFSGWDQSLSNVRYDTTYVAQYDSEIRLYTATFENYDNTVLFSQTFEAGATPFYSGTVPVKPANQKYAYSFKGWDKAFSPIYQNTIYVAQYEETQITYEVRFQNYDQTLLETDYVAANDTAVYKGTTPERAADDSFTYTFSGWDSPLTGIVADTTFTAQFKADPIQYVVTFKNYDDTVLYVDQVVTGASAVYKGATPNHPADDNYIYTFSGWDKALADIKEDTTLVAQYTKSSPEFTVTFKNYDGTVLGDDTVKIGETAVYSGATPTRKEDDQYTYTFKGWDRSLDKVNKNFFTLALYESTLKEFDVYFDNWDGTELQKVTVPYGEAAVYSGSTPLRDPDENYTYVFKGWNEDVSKITKELTTYALFDPIPIKKTTGTEGGGTGGSGGGSGGSTEPSEGDLILVTFYNWNSEFIDEDDVPRGGTAYCEADTPTRPDSTKYKNYTFTSFDKNLTNVQKMFSTYAQYTVEDPITSYERDYIVTFRNDDESLIYEDVVGEGEMPSYKLSTAPKSSQKGTWLFTGWDRALVSAYKSYTVYATYKLIEAPSTGGAETGGGIAKNPTDNSDPHNVFTYTPTYGGAVHFREKSYGDLSANQWGEPLNYCTNATLTTTPLYYAANKMAALGASQNSLSIKYALDHQYALLPNYSLYDPASYVSDCFCSPTSSLTQSSEMYLYDFSETTYNSLKGASFASSALTSEEQSYRDFVKAHYLTISSEEKTFFGDIVSANQLSAATPSGILAARDYIKYAAKYNADFKAYPLGEDYSIYFLKTAKEGICNHFASALTVLYRAMGLPARFVTGYLSTAKENTECTVTTKEAHAWTEIYLDGIGWMSIDATPGADSGESGKIEQPKGADDDNPFGDLKEGTTAQVIIYGKAADSSKIYDGKAMEVSGTYSGNLDPGDSIEYGLKPGESNVGYYTVKLTPKIVNSSGTDVTLKYANKVTIKRDNYEITPRAITVTTASAEKVRDGQPLEKPLYSITTGSLVDGQLLVVKVTGSQTTPGFSMNTVDLTTFKIVDANGVDQSQNYQVCWVYGKLEIK
jgi:transglutaminase-like putative cysteine protease